MSLRTSNDDQRVVISLHVLAGTAMHERWLEDSGWDSDFAHLSDIVKPQQDLPISSWQIICSSLKLTGQRLAIAIRGLGASYG